MSTHQRDLFTLWDVVQRKLQTSLSANRYPGRSLDIASWPDIPLALAERGLFLRGLPSVCKPEVHKDVVQDDLISWSMDKLLSLERAMDSGSLTIGKRKPLSRRVIMEITEPDGTVNDSTLGFSDQWMFDHMFCERLYESLTVPDLKSMNVNTFMTILEKANISHTGVPWIVLPGKLWASSQYISGMPRNCLPKVVDDKVEADDPSPATKWRKDQRISFQRSADSGLLKILPRPPDRDVIFEVLETDGLLRDDDCGFSQLWKRRFPIFPEPKVKPHGKSKLLAGPTMVPPFVWQQINIANQATSQSGQPSKKTIVTERYAAFLRFHGLLLESPDGPAWVYVPQMLATRRCYILGLPRDCLPIVRDDDVVANYDPRQWSSAAQDSFLQATDGKKLVVVSNTNRLRLLYRVVEPSGMTMTDETIGFSEKWLRENLDSVDLADPTVSPSMFVQELWLCMLESVNIPCHDHRGRRRIPWVQLPMFLAHRRGYIAGCPLECHPKVEDDVVSEMSAPSFWDEQQVRLMADAFIKNNVSVCSRKPNRNVLFTHVVDGDVVDSTCDFSAAWVQLNLHAIPNSISTPLPISGLSPVVPAAPGPAPAPEPSAPSSSARPQKVTLKRYGKRARDPIALLAAKSVPSATNGVTPVVAQTGGSNQSTSLKIIIPAFKRRNLLAKKEAENTGNDVPPSDSNVTEANGRLIPVTRTKRNTHPLPAVPRHILPARRSSLRFGASIPLQDYPPPTVDALATSDDDKPGAWGLRSSMSPPLPPRGTLPNPLPEVPIPTFLPVPGGGLTWDDKRSVWELTVSETWPPEKWKKQLPVFPARVLWNAVQQVWMCEPSRSLTKPNNQFSQSIQAALEASSIEGPVPSVKPGLSIIWHRWRRRWGLFEYVSPIKP